MSCVVVYIEAEPILDRPTLYTVSQHPALPAQASLLSGSKAINAHRRAMKKDRRAKAVEKEKRVVDLGGGASWSILPTGAMVMRRTVPRLD